MSRRQALAWAFIALGLTYALLIGGAPAGVELPLLRTLSVGITGVAVVIWALLARSSVEWRPRSVLTPALAACIGAMALSTATSRSPRISVEYLAYAVLLAGLYLLLVELTSRAWLRGRILALAGMVGVVLAFAYVALALGSWIELWRLVGRLSAPPLRPDFQSLIYGNPAPALTMIVLLTATAIGRGWGPQRRNRAFAAAISVLALIAAVLTGTRAGIVAIGVGVVVLLVLLAIQPRVRSDAVGLLNTILVTTMRTTAGRIVGAVVVVVAIAAIVAVGPGLIQRFSVGGDPLRATFYVIAVRMFAAAPVTGVGPGMWSVERLAYTEPTEPDYYVPHAHDVYVQTAAELGIVGLVAGLAAAAFVAWLLRDGFRDADPMRRRWAWIAAFCLAFFGADQLLDFHLNIPATLVALAIPVAVLDASANHGPRRLPSLSAGARRLAWSIASAAVALAVITGLWLEGPALQHQRAVDLANGGEWVAARSEASAAAGSDPGMPVYRFTAGLTAASAGDLQGAQSDLAAFAAASQLPEAWLDLAEVQYELGSLEASRSSLVAALRLGIQRPSVAIAAANLAISLGEPDVAIDAASHAIVEAPSIAADPWWTGVGEPIRSASMGRALGRTSGDVRWEIALMSSGDALLFAEQEGRASPLVKDIILAWSGAPDAASRVYDACHAAPLTGPLNWCTRIASHLGDKAAAGRFGRWAEIAGWGDDQLGEWRVAPSGSHALAPAIAGGAVFYGLDVYRRFTPWDLLVPGLLHVVVE